ncbi:MAG TPA: ParB/RepB/Spo0J family partition protein [Clostridiaceae bacterium]|nr:ParB/RepB/Spo0J family partition protein [Clostridiaceae bacterium]
MAKKALGRGLGALINTEENREENLTELKINEIEPNINQPRKNFDDEKLVQLAESIKQHGVVQPIVVKKEKNTYKIVAGERRWRAARIAGLKTIPVIIKDLTDKQLMEIALIENLQREDLNPIEEAEAYENLMKEYNMTQEEISKVVGKSRSAIANSIRLLGLVKEVRDLLISGEISSGHARALLAIENEELQIKAAKEIISRGLNVRETENLVKRYLKEKKEKTEKIKSEELIEIEEKFKDIFGTKVKITPNSKKGKIMIEYYSSDELERIIELIMGIGKNR